MSAIPASLGAFVDEAKPSAKSLVLLNRSRPVEVASLLDRAFADQSVSVADVSLPAGPEDVVCLVEDGHVTAATPLSRLEETFLLVNSDRYRTSVDDEPFPSVLTGMDDVAFTVRGFPRRNKEKLLLVVISRFIERRALAADGGELHATFQRLSRLDDERGTRQMYERLARSDVDAHVYGVLDDPTAVETLDLTVHAGDHAAYRDSWVVLFAPPDGGDHVALVAVETGPNRWRGTWTYEPSRVERVRTFLNRRF
jgi:DICT domain-containing protein